MGQMGKVRRELRAIFRPRRRVKDFEEAMHDPDSDGLMDGRDTT